MQFLGDEDNSVPPSSPVEQRRSTNVRRDQPLNFKWRGFLTGAVCRFPRFEDVFCWFLHSVCWMYTIFLLPV